MKRIAQSAAYLFHPIFVPVYLMLFLMEVEPVMSLYFGGERKWSFLMIMSLNLVAGPVLSIYFLKKNAWIDSLTMPTLKGRSLTYLMTALWYILTYFLVQKIGLPIVARALFTSLITVLLVLAAVSIKHKTSAHVASLGGCLGVLAWMFTFYGIWEMTWFIIALLLTGFQATCRLYLQAHTEREIISGFLIGFLCTYSCMWLIIS